MAPDEAFTATGVTDADLLFCMTTPSNPAASAVLIMAPRLCGSSILSNITSLFAPESIISSKL